MRRDWQEGLRQEEKSLMKWLGQSSNDYKMNFANELVKGLAGWKRRQVCVPMFWARLAIFMAWLICPMRSWGLEPFPLQDTVQQAKAALAETKIQPTGLGRSNYLEVISGIANYFHHFQDEQGRIIDPFLHKEFQYSTPCYAWAAAALVASGQQTNLLESAAMALDCALTELAKNRAAMSHGDFFTFPCLLAYENLREHVAPDRRHKWESLLRQLQPELCYSDVLRGRHQEVHNWNVVALSGEFLRHQDGFTGMTFVEKYLALQMTNFTATGQYRDPNVPMAYDHFPRHFLAAILERGYDGEHRAALEELLQRAAWTSLLMQSPNGELPTGGRSAQHQWNEAQQCVTYEIFAKRNQRAGDAVAARAFKRAAHLALASVQRWIRPSGELWIVKNRFDPAGRHGFEGYSSHSQYNLLAASMLATAWLMADDAIAEGTCPADAGGFAFALPEYHKVFANAGGLYLEIDTGAQPEYNSTGLIRVQKSAVETLIGPTDSAPIKNEPLAVGVAWPEGGGWKSLASCGRGEIKSAKFELREAKARSVKFSVRYEMVSGPVKAVVENYEVAPEQAAVRAEVEGATHLQIRFPAFVFDGQDTSGLVLEKNKAAISLHGSREIFSVESPVGHALRRSGDWISCRNGYLEAIEGEVAGPSVTYKLRPERMERPAISQADIKNPPAKNAK